MPILHRLSIRVPKATLLAIFLIFLAELFLRVIPTERLLPRPNSGPGVHTDTGQSSILAMIDARGAADIALVGSSMMREAVNVPQMRDTLRTRFHRKLTVGDYSVRGARIEEFAAITHELLVGKRPPKLIFIGLSLRDLQIDSDERRRQALSPYWQLDDWYGDRFGSKSEARNRNFETIASEKQIPIRDLRPALWPATYNTILRHYRTLRYREALRNLILHPTRKLPPVEANPITGSAGENYRSLVVEGLVTVKDIRKQLARQSRTNSLAIDQSALGALEQLITGAQSRGVKIILLEMPIPKVMRKALPRAEYDHFLSRIAALATSNNVPFFQSADFAKLNFPPKDGYFLDSQHMNTYGNTRFATILATITARSLTSSVGPVNPAPTTRAPTPDRSGSVAEMLE